MQTADLASRERGVADFAVFLQVAMTVGKALHRINSLHDVWQLNAFKQSRLWGQQSDDIVSPLPAFQPCLTQDQPQTTLHISRQWQKAHILKRYRYE